ncbi:DUF4367 domain-containing protein [Paenibacillus segetis]|uniref:DUF4367 domain-containing protein n=1 Tax=Paenibacillus segetis TaxID=1325360 RepID=A0ABQ1YGW0_9BACL|nr:DUF4367 domain-containing protein [Paenibacillus segetis]GGH23883.1 hypothetical protein GCM10008013_23300 [Paenibacillus segetis]
MSKKSAEQQFSKELDAYMISGQGPSKVDSEEYNELFEFGKRLADRDFSRSSNKGEILLQVRRNSSSTRGDEDMKKTKKMKRPVIAAATLAVVGVLSIGLMKPAFAQDIFGRIVQSVSLGHITVEQHEYPTGLISIPSELEGKIFDRDGNPVVEIDNEHPETVYTASGEEVVGFINGEVVTKAEQEKLDQENKVEILVVNNPNQLNDYTCFDVILPTYLPEGFSFDRAEFYKGDDGTVSNSKYINLFFKNEKTGKSFIMQNRFADEETAFIRSTDGTVEAIKINDQDAVLVNERDIDWEYKGVIYGIAGKKSGLDPSELIRIAESIQ